MLQLLPAGQIVRPLSVTAADTMMLLKGGVLLRLKSVLTLPLESLVLLDGLKEVGKPDGSLLALKVTPAPLLAAPLVWTVAVSVVLSFGGTRAVFVAVSTSVVRLLLVPKLKA
jgi:hypothetical protein